LNLATQPFQNEGTPALLLGVAAVAVLGLTVQHALVVRELLPARTSGVRQEAAALEAESARLRAEERSLRAPRAAPAGMGEWTLIKELVDRRAFSWTLLFAHLESVLPYGVRLTSIAPSVRKGDILIEVSAEARRPEDAREFVRRLEGREEFDDVYLVEESEGGEVRFTMKYRASGRAVPGGAGEAEPAEALGAPEDGSRAPFRPGTGGAPAGARPPASGRTPASGTVLP
jgi:Tfp pilus assembly protein PilN